MHQITAEDIRLKLIEARMADEESIVGCTDDEIAEIQNKQDVKEFPEFYRSVMKLLGQSAGKLFDGTTEFYYKAHCASNLREEAQSILIEDGVAFLLTQESFVIAMHQAYTFLFIYVNSDDYDPVVYSYLQGGGIPRPIGRLSELLLQEINAFKRHQVKDS